MADLDTWVQPADVPAVTGAEVADTDVIVAQQVVEVACGRTFDQNLRQGDLKWLRKAVAHQAAWQVAQGGTEHLLGQMSGIRFERFDVSSRSWGVVGSDTDPLRQLLAPMARMAIGRCSFRRPRTIRTPVRRVRGD